MDQAADQPFGGEGIASAGSAVGYIDPARPTNMFRVRLDAAYKNNRPNRAEYFYARGYPQGPGLPLPEVAVDYQDIRNYLEYCWTENFSTFFEVSARFLNPIVNDNTAGLADTHFGGKFAFVNTCDRVVSGQLRVYAPTGDAGRGLGTRHFSLEPGVLFFAQPDDLVRVEGEAKLWIPVGGTDFQGQVAQYGVGVSFGPRSQCAGWINPVVEFVGWTALNGRETAVFFPGAVPVIQEAGGDTILNAKLGVRAGLGDRFDVYAGWGRALTGDVWYKNLYRLEFRLMY
jgi:hypothetical protein